eukprot:m.237751 g.237751  ORF g.237751 m.237751 type:complete len:245 (+) comp54335_c0_seq7:1153-1887(+)
MQAQIDNRGSALSRPGQAQGYQDPRPAHGGPDPYRRERWDDYPPSREEYPPPPPAAEYSRDRDFQSRDFPPPPRGKPELPLHCPPGHLRVLSTTVWIGGIQERDAEYLKSEVYKLTGVKSMQNSLERHCSFVQFNSRDEAETALDILTNTFQAGKELKVRWGRGLAQKDQSTEYWNWKRGILSSCSHLIFTSATPIHRDRIINEFLHVREVFAALGLVSWLADFGLREPFNKRTNRNKASSSIL